jgi:hypothetical protein
VFPGRKIFPKSGMRKTRDRERAPTYLHGPWEYRSLSFEVDHRRTWDLRRRTGIIPVKDSHTRIKLLALASGHGRYITVTPERTLAYVRWGMAFTYSRYKFVTVSLPKRFRNGRFTSETATWIQKYFKKIR